MPNPSDFSKYTDGVIGATGKDANPRLKQLFPLLIQKLHEFIIESDVTVDEWMATCDLLIEAGKISSEKRNEMVLVSDILGVESLCDILQHMRNTKNDDASTGQASESAILGPFYRSGVPVQEFGTPIVRQDEPEGEYTHLYGKILDADGKPMPNALVDIWHDAPDGLYDAQTPEKPEYHCRGRFKTDEQGRYDTICLRPCPYPIPYDGPAGKMLKLLDRHPFRPAHIHFWIEAPGHKKLVTQVFDRKSKYLEDDSVFAVKDSLLVDFLPIGTKNPDWKPPANVKSEIKFELEYDIKLTRE